jgi:hypothetical protein
LQPLLIAGGTVITIFNEAVTQVELYPVHRKQRDEQGTAFHGSWWSFGTDERATCPHQPRQEHDSVEVHKKEGSAETYLFNQTV